MSPAAAVTILFLALASVTDLRERRVPNQLAGAAAITTLICRLCFGSFDENAIAILATLILSLPLCAASLIRPDALGMGDVKTIAVIALGVGPQAFPAVAMAGILCTVTFLPAALVFGAGRVGRMTVPFVPFLAAGTLAALCW